jgi:hypothetical protein
MGRSLDTAGAVGGHAVHAPLRGRGHFSRRRRALDEAPQVRGGPPAQGRVVTAGPNGGEEGGVHAARAVPYAVDASMLAQERPGAQPLPDLRGRDARGEQLHARHHPVRPTRQISE